MSLDKKIERRIAVETAIAARKCPRCDWNWRCSRHRVWSRRGIAFWGRVS